MNAKSLLGLLSIALLLGACKKDLEPQVASESPAAPTAPQGQNAPMVQPTATPSQPVTAQAMTAPTQPGNVAAGMNPAHGQPGHRCDIAVGAPLNSAPAKLAAAQPAMTITPGQGGQQAVKMTPTTTGTPALLKPPAATATATPVATAPGMNPPHGQPGHRCDIAVGAPLSSPPGNTAAAAVKADPIKADPNKMEITVSDPAKSGEKKAE